MTHLHSRKRTSREELGDGHVKYTYDDGTTVTAKLKPVSERRKWVKQQPWVGTITIPENQRVMPATRPFKDARRQYKGQHTVG